MGAQRRAAIVHQGCAGILAPLHPLTARLDNLPILYSGPPSSDFLLRFGFMCEVCGLLSLPSFLESPQNIPPVLDRDTCFLHFETSHVLELLPAFYL